MAWRLAASSTTRRSKLICTRSPSRASSATSNTPRRSPCACGRSRVLPVGTVSRGFDATLIGLHALATDCYTCYVMIRLGGVTLAEPQVDEESASPAAVWGSTGDPHNSPGPDDVE